MSETGSGLPPPRRVRPPGETGRRITAIAVALVILVAGVGTAEYVLHSPLVGGTTLVIYTYPSLFGGSCGAPAFSTVFGEFASAHGVRIEVECPTTTLVSTLLAEENAPVADLVIGLDEVTAPEAANLGLLIPYSPPNLANVPGELETELSSSHAATPYEYGYLGIDYNTTFAAATSGAVAHLTFPEIADNASWARQFLYEDPTTDITGEEFLAWEVEYYETVLHENWETFWQSILPLAPVAPDWGTAFDEFTETSGNPGMVVSYTTDPAYEADYGPSGAYNSTVSWSNGTAYGWKTIYGIGIVNGTKHLGLDEEFVNWFLNGTVQAEIPETEWEYPANETVPLPSYFAAALPPAEIIPLNDQTSPAQLAADLPGWLTTWQELSVSDG